MRFSMLTPPTDAPSRIPLSRGLPSASAMAVDTSSLPRALPLPAMDPNAIAAPYEALARMAAAGQKVSSDIGTLIVAAEAKKRNANDTAETEKLYTEMALGVDQDFEQLKVTETDETIRPAFNKMWNTRTLDSLAKAPNAQVRADLTTKLNKLLLTKSGEVSDVARKKFVNRHEAQLDADVSRLTDRAMDPALSARTQKLHEEDLQERLRKAAASGLYEPERLQKMQERSLNTIKVSRANTWAYNAPQYVLDQLREGNDFGGLDGTQQRNLKEYAEGRIRTLRSDAVNLRADEDRAVKAAQDEHAMGWRKRITENYQTGGAGLDLLQDINTDMRRLGETNHAQILEMNQSYRQRFLKPENARKSDPQIRGEVQLAIDTNQPMSFEKLNAYFQAHTRGDPGLDEGDYSQMSGLLRERNARQKAEREKPKNDAEKLREQEVRQAEKTIDDFLKRGSRWQGDMTSIRSDILVRDGINELHLRLRADPSLNPQEVAGDMIANRIAQVESIAKGLPYKDETEVLAAYQAGLIDKATATLYYKIFKARTRGKPTPGAPTPEGGTTPGGIRIPSVPPPIRKPDTKKGWFGG